MVEKHGPFTDPINSTEGSIVYVIVADPDDPDQSHNQASISSPTYRDSYVKCEFIFWYYIGMISHKKSLITIFWSQA